MVTVGARLWAIQARFCSMPARPSGRTSIRTSRPRLQFAVGAEIPGVADLAVHFSQRVARPLWVVVDPREPAAGVRLGILEVGHVDIDDSVEQTQDLDRIVGVGVVDDRNREPARCGDRQRPNQLRHLVRWRDPVDVVAATVLKIDEDRRQLLVRDRSTDKRPRSLRDVVVLAEGAAQVAVGEEDGARAAAAGNHRFLTVVGVPGGDDRDRRRWRTHRARAADRPGRRVDTPCSRRAARRAS